MSNISELSSAAGRVAWMKVVVDAEVEASGNTTVVFSGDCVEAI